jgi:hypothetical protein
MRRPPFTHVLLWMLTVGLVAGGCGSKISEANYFRVKYGMSEEEVEELLGPAHAEASEPLPPESVPRPRPSIPPRSDATRPAHAGPASTRPATRPALRKVKTWSREGMTIQVTFEHGFVTARSAEGIAADPPATAPATRAVSVEVSARP